MREEGGGGERGFGWEGSGDGRRHWGVEGFSPRGTQPWLMPVVQASSTVYCPASLIIIRAWQWVAMRLKQYLCHICVCNTVIHAQAHTHRERDTHTARVTDGHFFQFHCPFGSVRPSVSVGWTIKQILPLSLSFSLPLLSECMRVFVCQQRVSGSPHISATCDLQGMKNLPSVVLSLFFCFLKRNSYFSISAPQSKLRNTIHSVWRKRKNLVNNGFFMSSNS